MVYNYVVILRRNNDKYIDTINLLLCFLSILAFSFEQIQSRKINYLYCSASLVLAIGILLNFHLTKAKKKMVRYKNLLIVAGVFWIFMPYLQIISAAFFFLAILEYQAKYPLEVGFTREKVVINSLFKRKYVWSEFNNIVLKDGLLTLDFKNNRIFQKETLEDEEPDADEDEFNDFCREQLRGIGVV